MFELKKYIKKIDKKVIIFLLILIFFSGIVKGYNFKEWLLFRADQVRDADMAKNVLDNGLSELTLLGPRITSVKLPGEGGNGNTLYMGPYYYYLQAFSMKVFNNPAPWTMAIPDFILAVLSVPLFYLVISKVFSVKTSLMTTSVFSLSFLILQYSRFSWNPNSLVFWHLVLIFCLLEFSFRKNNPGNWLVGAFFALMIISQLHFLSIVGTTLIFIIFFIYQKSWQKINSKHYLAAFLLFTFFYTPVIVSDIKNNGDNLKRLMASVSQQSSSESFKDNFLNDFKQSSNFYLYFPLSVSDKEFAGINSVGIVYLILSLILVGLFFVDKVKFLKIKNSKQKRILAFLIIVYFIVFFLVDIGIANRLEKPRYWLSIGPIAFLILAFWLELLNDNKNKIWSSVAPILLIGFLIFQNGYSIYFFYSALDKGDRPELPYKDPIFRPHRNLVTFGQIERISDQMIEKALKEEKNICYLSFDNQTKGAFKYVIKYKEPTMLVKGLDISNESTEDCLMFSVEGWSKDSAGVLKDLPDRFNCKKISQDKALSLWELNVSSDEDLPERGNEIFIEKNKKNKVKLWGEVF